MPCWAGRRPDPFPMRCAEAWAARLTRPTHQACGAIPQPSAQAPQALAARLNVPTDAAYAQAPQACSMCLNRPSDAAWAQAPQACASPPQAHAASRNEPSDAPWAATPQAAAAGVQLPSAEACTTMRNRVACDDHAPRLPAQRVALQLPPRRRENCQNATDLARRRRSAASACSAAPSVSFRSTSILRG
jgi:hypothetical protein